MSVLPLYHRIFLSLRDQIVNGAYDWWAPMPSEQQLGQEFGVSRATIRRALELLEEEGLVVRRQGARTYAKGLGYQASQQRRNLDLVNRGGNYRNVFAGDVQQNYEVVAADKELRRQFGKLNEVGRIKRVRESRGKPYCFVVTYMPLAIADKIDWRRLGTKPVITAVLEAGYEHAKVEQVIRATIADVEAATALAAPVGSPLLLVTGLFVDKDDKTLMRKDGYFLPESFEYRMTLYNKGFQPA